MYTHVSTMPRPNKKEKSIKNKGKDQAKCLKNKIKDSKSINRSQSMRCSLDSVKESPLLSALKGRELSNLDRPKESLKEPEVDEPASNVKSMQLTEESSETRKVKTLSTGQSQTEQANTDSKPSQGSDISPEPLYSIICKNNRVQSTTDESKKYCMDPNKDKSSNNFYEKMQEDQQKLSDTEMEAQNGRLERFLFSIKA